ncbi:MAG: class I SAM-dependent methyltransferase [Bacteroides sp.]
MGLVSIVTRFVPRQYLHRVAHWVGGVISLFLRGKRYEDPIDGYRYRKLLPYGRIEKRVNALAPHSLSLERHRLIWLYLVRELAIAHHSFRVLHIAPEMCLQRKLKKISTLQYTSADLISPWAEVHCDIQALPFADNSFDLILCNHVLEHIPNDRLAMRELYRVLAPRGVALLLVPLDDSRAETLEDPAINTDALREKYYHQRDHLRLYGRDYVLRLQEAGFEVSTLDYVATLTPEERTKYCIRDSDKLYVARKK